MALRLLRPHLLLHLLRLFHHCYWEEGEGETEKKTQKEKGRNDERREGGREKKRKEKVKEKEEERREDEKKREKGKERDSGGAGGGEGGREGGREEGAINLFCGQRQAQPMPGSSHVTVPTTCIYSSGVCQGVSSCSEVDLWVVSMYICSGL